LYLRNQSQEGPPGARHDAALLGATTITLDITDDIAFSLNWWSVAAVTTPSRSYHHGSASIGYELADALTFDVSGIFDRVERAVTTANGATPKRDDYQLIFGLGVDL
jgi:hypothetical protein